MKLKNYFDEAVKPLLVKRSIRVALLVGVILNIINQGHSIVNGFSNFHTLQFLLTFLIPYLVATYAAVLSKFNFISGEVANVNAQIKCSGCGDSALKIHKGELVPYCPTCETKTRWKIVTLISPVSVVEDDKDKSSALFAEFNPAPVLRVNGQGHIIRANPTARILFNIEGNGERLTDVILVLQDLDFEKFIASNSVMTYQIQTSGDAYQLDLKAVSDLGVFHIYASKNTQLLGERNKRLVFQTAIENTSDSVIVTDALGDIIYVNAAFENHSGYSLKEIEGKNPRFLKSGYQDSDFYKELWRIILSGKVWNGLLQNKKKNGEIYWEKAVITPIIGSDGIITHYLASKQDITLELKQEESLKSFALFAKHNPAPVLRITYDGIIKEANPAANNIFNSDNIVGLNVTYLMEEFKPLDIKAIINNNAQEYLIIQSHDLFYQLVIKGVSDLGLCHIYGSDITASKNAEKVIDSMALFAKLNPEPVFRFDADFSIIEFNPAAKNTFPEMEKGFDVRFIIPAFAEINTIDFIANNGISNRQEKVYDNVYRFMIRGLSQTNVCQVYSSDITKRVAAENEIKEQAEKIQSSIRYASNIQAAVLPSLNIISDLLPHSMILNLPRDVVSGDFYWVKKVEDSIVIAIADCTGHGVPGAFMSMLGVAFLNEIVKPGSLVANEILNKLRQHVIETLSNSEGSRADGMDMSLVILQPQAKTIQYAGAHNPFVLINSLGVQLIKADRMPIGTYVKQEKSFTLHEIPYQSGDVVYLFSDGYQDQLGGEKILKFGSKNFRELLAKIYTEDFDKQKEILNNALTEWTKTYQRIDDVLVMGFKLP